MGSCSHLGAPRGQHEIRVQSTAPDDAHSNVMLDLDVKLSSSKFFARLLELLQLR